MEEEHYGNNWDLHAVVRFGCRRGLSPPSKPDPFAALHRLLPPLQETPAGQAPVQKQETDAGWRFPDISAGGGGASFGRDADELLKALCAASPPRTLPLPLPTAPQQEQKTVQPVLRPAEVPRQAAAPASAPARAQSSGRQVSVGVPRSKRRKNQQKKVVCHVAADGVSSDVWAWRKYGQKPIKGSPYPRGYYRCSSSKGCAARKQVERSRADPNTFILTFTGEHNHPAPTHRNSLAGTSRHKFPSTSSATPQPPPPSVVVAGEAHAHLSPASTSAGLSPTTPLRTSSMEEDDEEEDELLVEDMEMAGEDEFMFLHGDRDPAALDGGSALSMSSLFDADEPFLSSPWAGAVVGQKAKGAAGAGS